MVNHPLRSHRNGARSSRLDPARRTRGPDTPTWSLPSAPARPAHLDSTIGPHSRAPVRRDSTTDCPLARFVRAMRRPWPSTHRPAGRPHRPERGGPRHWRVPIVPPPSPGRPRAGSWPRVALRAGPVRPKRSVHRAIRLQSLSQPAGRLLALDSRGREENRGRAAPRCRTCPWDPAGPVWARRRLAGPRTSATCVPGTAHHAKRHLDVSRETRDFAEGPMPSGARAQSVGRTTTRRLGSSPSLMVSRPPNSATTP
jgi:hypothetical protein